MNYQFKPKYWGDGVWILLYRRKTRWLQCFQRWRVYDYPERNSSGSLIHRWPRLFLGRMEAIRQAQKFKADPGLLKQHTEKAKSETEKLKQQNKLLAKEMEQLL